MEVEEQNKSFLNRSKQVMPLAMNDWINEAEKVLKKDAFEYISRGSGEEATMRANREAFNKWKISHRVLRNVSERNQTITLFGDTISSPIFFAPIGVQTIAHPNGELASARAAAELNIPFISSTAATFSMEQIAEVMGTSPRWFQLYYSDVDHVTESMVKRAEASGYSAIVITVDTPILGLRERDFVNNYSPLKEGKGSGSYFSDPTFCSLLDKPIQEDREAAILKQLELFENPSLEWESIKKIRNYTTLPILLKGVVDPEDTKLALQYNVDGIIVSNHGGRQLDHGMATLDALEQITHIVQGGIPVLFDSGIRRGTDIFKALALGASAVLLGRPYMYGLAVAGEEGVKNVVQQIQKELDVTMALSGVSSISEIDRSLLVRK